ncbi:MAG: chemotaxis protein [Clostridia bacterium BRH_c25]|nr:MAG: chemotaxis protein [Clostridia bacterium BRH_c25]
MFNLKLMKKNKHENIDTKTSTAKADLVLGSVKGEKIALQKNNQRCIIDRIDNKIGAAGLVVDSLINVTGNISNYVEIQMDSIQRVVDEISSYSALAEEVFANTENAKQISEQTMNIARQGSSVVDNSIRAMNDIESSVLESKEVVNMLSSKAAHINEMLNVIKDIADSTNLLSLNASIEAARAGETGRGFAVVAQEVKKLAQRSVESIAYINNTINEINDSIVTAVDSMDKTIDKVKEGTDISKNTMEVFNTIIKAVDNSSSVSDEINTAITKQTANLETVVNSTHEMSRTFEKLITTVEQASLYTQFTRTSLESLQNTSSDLKSATGKLIHEIAGPDAFDSVVTTCIPSSLQTYDPHMSFEYVGSHIMSNVNSGLLTISSSGQIIPGIAKNWYLEDDDLTWVFQLRRGAKFHNGREITAEDVKYSFERVLSPKLNSPNSWALMCVDGAEEYNTGREEAVRGVRVLDKYRISISLTMPYSGFLLNLGQFCTAILPVEDIEKGDVSGCGPYKLVDVQPSGATLEAFKDFYNGEPYIKKIIVKFNDMNAAEELKSSGYDFIIADKKDIVNKVKDAPGITVKTKSIIGTYYAGFNLLAHSTYVQNKEVRKALNMAINKKRIINELLGGLGIEAKGPFPPSMVENTKDRGYEYNLRSAREILQKNGLSRDMKKLKILAREAEDTSIYNPLTEYIINDFKEIGIECELIRVKSSQYLNPECIEQCDIYVSRWIGDTGDPDNFLQPLFNSESMTNFSSYKNEFVTMNMNKAKEIVNPEKRTEMYKSIQHTIVDDAPWIFLYHPQSGIAFKNNIAGIRLSQLGLLKYEDIILEDI